MLPYLFTPLHTNPSPLPLASQIKKKKEPNQTKSLLIRESCL